MDPKVRQYMMQKYFGDQQPDIMGGSDQAVTDAQGKMGFANKAQAIAGIGDVIANNSNQPRVLYNRMQDLGKAPTTVGGEKQKTDLSGMQRMAQTNLDTAKSERDKSLQLMLEQRKSELAAEAAAKRQAIEDDRWNKDFSEKQTHNRAMEKRTKEVDPTVAAVRAEQLAKLQRDAQQHEDALNVPGFERTGEVRQAPDEAKNARDAIGIANNIKGGIETLKSQMGTHGNFELGGSGGAAMDVTANDLRLQLKELNKLGVLNGPDLALMLQQIPDTSSLGQMFTRKSTTDAQLQQVLENINRKIETGMSAKGYKAKGAASAKPQTVNQNGHTYTLNPQTGEYE